MRKVLLQHQQEERLVEQKALMNALVAAEARVAKLEAEAARVAKGEAVDPMDYEVSIPCWLMGGG